MLTRCLDLSREKHFSFFEKTLMIFFFFLNHKVLEIMIKIFLFFHYNICKIKDNSGDSVHENEKIHVNTCLNQFLNYL